MTTVTDVERALLAWAPRELAEDWDNVGLLCGRAEREVTRILVALDPFEDACREAHERGAELIVTHHPLIFAPLRAVTDRDGVGRTILFLARHDIAAINLHTNLDRAVGGVNDVLAETLGLREVSVLAPKVAGEGMGGLLRVGTVKETTLTEFAAQVKERLQCPGLRLSDAGRSVHRVAIGGGACGSELWDAHDAGCDTFVTADVKYNQFWDARELGINLIDAGHFETENPVCEALAAYLRAQFPAVTVLLSKRHASPIRFL